MTDLDQVSTGSHLDDFGHVDANYECPQCDGTGDYAYQGDDGYAKYAPCFKCRGTGEIKA